MKTREKKTEKGKKKKETEGKGQSPLCRGQDGQILQSRAQEHCLTPQQNGFLEKGSKKEPRNLLQLARKILHPRVGQKLKSLKILGPKMRQKSTTFCRE